MRDDRRALGSEGEKRAARFLARRGYRIVARNVRAGGVELDLVAAKRDLLVFVEVKTRRSERYGSAAAGLGAAQRRRLLRGAHAYLVRQTERPARIRFDVIACTLEARARWRVRHWPGAFDASEEWGFD
ncbi:MAG: YraN family protein [Proteobacteria bacterium]|nr:YraN family protein [Pseudomonadota bacterium]